jgi:carboxylate-amine ligase
VTAAGADAVTVGVEEEFHLAEPGERGLAPAAERVLEIAAELGRELEPELQSSEVETATPVCRELAELAGQVAERRRGLLAAADRAGVGVVAAGTLPGPAVDGLSAYPKARYERLVDEYAEVGREQLVCALQVQVGVADREVAVAALPRLAPWLPVLLALSGSSPFYAGRDTGYASYRAVIWSRWPTGGPPLPFSSAAEYDRLVADLVDSGTIADPGMVYFDVRPSARYPTLEVRVCDSVPLLEDVVTLAALVRALVVTEVRTAGGWPASPPPRPELVRAARWRAARSGLGGVLLDPRGARALPAGEVVAALLGHVRPVLDELGETDRVLAGVEALVRRGTAADRQRVVYGRRERLADVVDALVAETRAGL